MGIKAGGIRPIPNPNPYLEKRRPMKAKALDLRSVEPAKRVSLVAESLNNLGSHQRLRIVQDQHPRELCDNLNEGFGGGLECVLKNESAGVWTFEVWRGGSCCGVC
jgi:uncharacterized protein (DUF2249 family)